MGALARRSFYSLISEGCSPPSPPFISRVVGIEGDGGECIVDEFVFSFTHDTAMDWMLPGLAPTGAKVKSPDLLLQEQRRR